MAFCGKYNSDYAARLKNALNFLVAQKYKINVFVFGNAGSYKFNMVTLTSS